MEQKILVLFCLLGCSQSSSRPTEIEMVPNDSSLKGISAQDMDEKILTMLRSKKDEDRMQAAKKIGEQKNAKYLRTVTRLLDDPNQSVRSWAAWALGEIGDRRSIQPLIRAFVKYNEISKTDHGQESRCLTAFYLALEKLSGKRFGLDVSKWEQWWLEENLLASVSGLP